MISEEMRERMRERRQAEVREIVQQQVAHEVADYIGDDITNISILVKRLQDAINEQKVEAGQEENGPVDFRFKTSSSTLVFLPEIAHDVTRLNPIVEVVQQGKDFKNYHHLLVYNGLLQKVRVVLSHFERHASEANEHIVVLKTLRFAIVTILVSEINLSELRMGTTFAEVLDALKWIQEYPMAALEDGAHKPITVVVRSR